MNDGRAKALSGIRILYWSVSGIAYIFLFLAIILMTSSEWLYGILFVALASISFYAARRIAGRFRRPGRSSRVKKETAEKRKDRETELWEEPKSGGELNNVKNYIITELAEMKTSNWGDYALTAVCTHSPKLFEFMVDGKINIELIRQHEKNGIDDATNAVKEVVPRDGMSLRIYFHEIFKSIYETTTDGRGNKFYWYGRDRVLEMLRSYKASIRMFTPSAVKFFDIDNEVLMSDANINTEIINKVKLSLEYFEKSVKAHQEIEEAKKYYRFKINSEYPIIEFDLETIEKAGNFKYEGSLVNSLYIELKNLLGVTTDEAFLGYWLTAEKLYDLQASLFAFETGTIVLVKYKGAVSYFPDRLYIELQDINPDNWLARWLTSYKLHVEGND